MAKTPVHTAAKRVGRPKKVSLMPVVLNGAPKKRGRPSKAVAVTQEVVSEPKPIPKKRGRPPKAAIAVAKGGPQPEPKSRRGRPRKTVGAVKAVAILPEKRAGRPPKNATGISLRITKGDDPNRASAASKPTPRVDPRVRSKLRTRTVLVKKELAPVQEAPKRRGRPPVKAKGINATKAPKTASRRGRPRKDTSASVGEKRLFTKKVRKSSVAKLAIPRKRRGYTRMEVPDKFATQLQEFLLYLQATDCGPAEQDGFVAESMGGDIHKSSPDEEPVKPVSGVAGPENEHDDSPCSLKEPTQNVQVDVEVQEEVQIQELATNDELYMREILERALDSSSSELTSDFSEDSFE